MNPALPRYLLIAVVVSCSLTFLFCAADRSHQGGDFQDISRSTEAFLPRPDLADFEHHPALEELILEATHAERRRENLPPLAFEATLAAIGREHSGDMLARDFFDHVDPDGRGPGERVAYGHRRLIGISGENIWFGEGYSLGSDEEVQALAERAMTGWMNSPGHRANILRAEFTHLGVGVATRGRKVTITQKFAGIDGYNRSNIPLELDRGDELDLSVVPAPNRPAPTDYDLWNPTSDVLPEPIEIGDGRIQVPSSHYELRFFFPTETPNRFSVVPGPTLFIR